MLCFDILVNGKKVCTVGHKDMELIQSSILYHFAMPNPHMSSSIQLTTSDELTKNARWNTGYLKIGDEVCIRLIESNTPDSPDEIVPSSSRLHPIPKKELFCSFCDRSENDVKRLLNHPAANVCDECVENLKNILDEEKKKEK